MDPLFLELKNILELQSQCLQRLLEIVREHSQALRRLDNEFIIKVIRREEEILSELKVFEDKRKAVTGLLSVKLCLSVDTPLSVFVKEAPKSLEKDLNGLSEDIGHQVKELAEINSLNGILTRQAMRVNDLVLKSFGQVENRVYRPSGRMTSEKLSRSMLDKKI